MNRTPTKRTKSWMLAPLALALAMITTGCRPSTGGTTGGLMPPGLPDMSSNGLTNSLNRNDNSSSVSNDTPPRADVDGQQIVEVSQERPNYNVLDGAPGADFTPPVRPGHDEATAAQNRLRTRSGQVRGQLSGAQQRLATLQATRPSICGNGPVAPCEASNEQRLQNIAGAQAEVDRLNTELNDLAGQLGVGA